MHSSIQNNIIYLVSALLVLSSFWMIYAFGINVPHWDDHAVRNFIDNSSITHIFSFHNEHRIGLTRLSALLTNLLSGKLNFKWLMYFGQFGLVGLFGCYIFLARELSISKLGLLILACCIFNFSTFENSLWGMAAVQNHGILFFAPAALITLSINDLSKRYIFVLATFFSLSCLVTSGNGVLIAPIGLVLLFFKGESKKAWYWLAIHTVAFTIYFIGFSRNGGIQPHIEDFFLNFIALGGSLVYPILGKNISATLPSVIGLANLFLAIWVFFRLLFLKDSNKRLLSYLGLQAFFFGTLSLIAISRNDYETAVLLSSKYKIYSFLIFGTSAFFGMGFLKGNKIRYGLVALTFLAFINSQWSYWPMLKTLKIERTADLFNLKKSTTGETSFKPTTLGFETTLNPEDAIPDANKVDSIAFKDDKLLFFENEWNSDSETYIWLKSKAFEYLQPVNGLGNSLVRHQAGRADLDLKNFKTDVYQIYLLEVGKSDTRLFNTKKTVRIEGVNFTEAPKNW